MSTLHQPNTTPSRHLISPLPPLLQACNLTFLFFISRTPSQVPDLTIQNLSTITLTLDDLTLVDKGLSFSPTPSTLINDIQSQTLHDYNDFAKSLRLKYTGEQYIKQKHNSNYEPPPPTMTSLQVQYVLHLPGVNFTQRLTIIQNWISYCMIFY